jgi:hypothetical protein
LPLVKGNSQFNTTTELIGVCAAERDRSAIRVLPSCKKRPSIGVALASL